MSLSRRKHGRQSGQALVELAFILPVLLLLALGVIEIGRYAYISILVGNAAHAGAMYASLGTSQAADQTGIQNAALYDFAGATSGTTKTNGQVAGNLTVTSAQSCGCDAGGSVATAVCDKNANPTAGTCATGHWVVAVSVTASGTFNSLFNYPGIPGSIDVSRTSTLRVF
jgi:Flp pilus assembly protein TadG